MSDAVVDERPRDQGRQQHDRDGEYQDGEEVAHQGPGVDGERGLEYQHREEHVEDQVVKAVGPQPRVPAEGDQELGAQEAGQHQGGGKGQPDARGEGLDQQRQDQHAGKQKERLGQGHG